MDFKAERAGGFRGFSLIELLAVIGIIILLAALTIPAIGGMMEGMRVRQAGERLVDEFNHARASALARNEPAEVCFLRMPDPSGGAAAYRAIRTRLIRSDGTAYWISQTRRFPTGIILADSAARSSILGSQTPETIADVPGVIDGVYVRINPNGRTELGNGSLSGPMFVTAGPERDLEGSGSTMPDNFILVRIDARNGRVTSFTR